MTRLPRLSTLLLAAIVLVAPATAVHAQAPGISREQMWSAPTAEDWRKPVQITFQRTWEDAVAVSRETGKPILACINMDGEIASEHYAGVRYRQPEIAKLYEPYVTVIASVYRHTPRDYDEEGLRVICPRFGSVTCGEHIAIEPILYDRYLDGARVAPRHVMIELDGSEVYDIYYAFDTDSVFAAIRDGIQNREIQPKNIVRGDRPILERVASHDIRDRDAVEKAFMEGDQQTRQAILDAAAKHGDVASVDLLRLGIFGFDEKVAKAARTALASSQSEAAVELIPEALKVQLEDEEREALVGALRRLGENSSSERARWLSVVHEGLSTSSTSVDAERLADSYAGSSYPAPEASDWMSLRDRMQSKADLVDQGTQDPEAVLEMAEASLAFATEASQALGVSPTTETLLTADPRMARMMSRTKYSEAYHVALEAEKLGADGWRVDAIVGIAAYYIGNKDEGYERCGKAVAALPSGETSWNAMAVLTIFAEGRYHAIKKAVEDKRRWPPRWVADVHSAYSVLLHHPLGTDGQVMWHHDFLMWLGTKDRASRVIQRGLGRFPDSAALHARFRERILEEKGAEGLEPAYANLLRRDEPSADLQWYAGLASFVAAEYHRRASNMKDALAAYDRSIEHYESAIAADEATRDASDLNIALALAGRARIAFEQGDYERCLTETLASFARRADAAGRPDGLNITPAWTGLQLRAKLLQLGRTEEAATIGEALALLDPEDLKEPFTSDGPPGTRRGGRRR